MGRFSGKGRTPGESWWKDPHWAQLSPPKPSCYSVWSILRNPSFKSWNFIILAHFGAYFGTTIYNPNKPSKWANMTKFQDFTPRIMWLYLESIYSIYGSYLAIIWYTQKMWKILIQHRVFYRSQNDSHGHLWLWKDSKRVVRLVQTFLITQMYQKCLIATVNFDCANPQMKKHWKPLKFW